jgi:DNA-binding CsgD family transcriptional regulator
MENGARRASKVVPVPTLRFDMDPFAGLRIRLDRDVATLGRQQHNHYVVPDPRVSRVHAELRKAASAVIITDLGSSAGTRINDQPIEGPQVLTHGDQVSFGKVTATFEDPAAAAQLEDTTMVFRAPKVSTGPRLSPRQQQVVDLVAQGMTNAEIGEQLGITERTVKAYAQELYDKLGVRNRAGAVAQAWSLGLLTDEPRTPH